VAQEFLDQGRAAAGVQELGGEGVAQGGSEPVLPAGGIVIPRRADGGSRARL
jgi:hypothetical protein